MEEIEIKEDNHKLQEIANHLYLKYFHHKLHCIVRFSIIYTQTDNDAGVTYYGNPARIYINPYNAETYDNKMAIAIIKHELIHYYLWKTHDKQGSGHTKHFYKIAKKIGADGSWVPWSLKFPNDRKEYKARIANNEPVYLYYSYKVGVYWRFYCMYRGSHITDKYDKKRYVYYLGFVPTSAMFKVLKHLRSICHKNRNLKTSELVDKLFKSPDLKPNGRYRKYTDKFFRYEDRIDRKKAFINKFRDIAGNFYNHEKDCNHKLQIIAKMFYTYYFHKKLNCRVCFSNQDVKYISKFSVKDKQPCIRVNAFDDSLMLYEDTMSYDYAKKLLRHLKISLVHYYLWSTHNPNGYKHTKDFYRIVKDKYNIDLILKDHPYPYKKDHRETFFYLYYSYGIGLYWRTNSMHTGDYAYDKNGKLHKVYYINEFDRECLEKCWSKLVQVTKPYQKDNLSTAKTVHNVLKVCTPIIRKTEHQEGYIEA